MTPLVREGYRRVKALTAIRAKSFFFASAALWGARKRAAYALYAACRRLDDLVDGGDCVDAAGLQEALATISDCYATEPTTPASPRFHPAELAALKDTIARFDIPKKPFVDLVLGMEMDLVKSRYANFQELELYCYRAAGTVGLLMSPVLGCSRAQALPAAVDLGIAMQLTNILRDVAEDFAKGRIYLPQDELAAFGISEEQVARGHVDDRWRDFMRWQIARARMFYARAAKGVPSLHANGAQRTVKLMGETYGRILERIEAQSYDVFSKRASVSGWQKVGIGVRVLVMPSRVFVPSWPAVSAPSWKTAA